MKNNDFLTFTDMERISSIMQNENKNAFHLTVKDIIPSFTGDISNYRIQPIKGNNGEWGICITDIELENTLPWPYDACTVLWFPLNWTYDKKNYFIYFNNNKQD